MKDPATIEDCAHGSELQTIIIHILCEYGLRVFDEAFVRWPQRKPFYSVLFSCVLRSITFYVLYYYVLVLYSADVAQKDFYDQVGFKEQETT